MLSKYVVVLFLAAASAAPTTTTPYEGALQKRAKWFATMGGDEEECSTSWGGNCYDKCVAEGTRYFGCNAGNVVSKIVDGDCSFFESACQCTC